MSDTTDYSKHTDDQLRDGIAKIVEQQPRISEEDSDSALAAASDQREAMQQELDRRTAS